MNSSELYDVEMFEIMVSNWLADESDQEDFVLDGKPYIDDFGNWAQDAHDADGSYMLVGMPDGNIKIV